MLKPLDASSYTPPSPHFFCGRGTVLATHANLPHWNKVNTAAFVTFRLADSLPQEKLLALEAQRTDWINAHPQPWDDATVREYFESFDLRVQEWLDRGMGSCVLADARCRAIVEDALWHFAGERYALYAYVVMPNHVHVLFMPTGDFQIRDLTASWKRFTARQINALLNQDGALWQKESFDTLVRSDRHFNTIMRYIKKNDLNKAWCFNRRVGKRNPFRFTERSAKWGSGIPSASLSVAQNATPWTVTSAAHAALPSEAERIPLLHWGGPLLH